MFPLQHTCTPQLFFYNFVFLSWLLSCCVVLVIIPFLGEDKCRSSNKDTYYDHNEDTSLTSLLTSTSIAANGYQPINYYISITLQVKR